MAGMKLWVTITSLRNGIAIGNQTWKEQIPIGEQGFPMGKGVILEEEGKTVFRLTRGKMPDVEITSQEKLPYQMLNGDWITGPMERILRAGDVLIVHFQGNSKYLVDRQTVIVTKN